MFGQDFYKYGPEDFTGLAPGTDAPEITCEPYTPEEGSPLAATYTCEAPVRNGPVSNGHGLAYNEICTSVPKPGLVYECYDVANGTDYSTFTSAIADGPIDCAKDPVYVYNIFLSNFILEEDGNIDSDNQENSIGYPIFNSDFADAAMFSNLVSDASSSPTESPTAAPTSSACSASFGAFAALVGVVATIF